MSKEEYSLDESIVLITAELVETKKFDRTGYDERVISGLEKTKSILEEVIEEQKKRRGLKDENT